MCGQPFWLLDDTVVAEDKSLNQMIASEKAIYDVTKLAKLAAFRDRLRDERNVKENRVQGRNRRGVTLWKNLGKNNGDTEDKKMGTGPYTMAYRKQLLSDLLELQSETILPLISEEEIRFIHKTWGEESINVA